MSEFYCIELNKNNKFIFNINKLSVQFSFNKSVVILLACVFCWVLLCNTTLYFILFIILFILFRYVFVHKENIFILDFWLPVVYLLFNVYVIFYLNYTSALIGEACFV